MPRVRVAVSLRGRIRADRDHRSEPSRRFAGWLAGAAALLALLVMPGGSPPAFARAAGSEGPSFSPRYDWALEVDGSPVDEARFFVEGKRILVQAPQLPKIALINTTGQQVRSLDVLSVAIQPDGEGARLAPGAEDSAQPQSYTMQGAQVLFFMGNKRLKITPKQHLEGPASQDQILRHSPLYRKGMDSYTPDKDAVAYLKSYSSPVRIEVFFGTWCPHCKELIPRFMKSLGEAANPKLSVSYVGVPKEFGTYAPARAKNVRGVPTFIFYRAESEFGRIPGEPTKGSIERAVADMLKTP